MNLEPIGWLGLFLLGFFLGCVVAIALYEPTAWMPPAPPSVIELLRPALDHEFFKLRRGRDFFNPQKELDTFFLPSMRRFPMVSGHHRPSRGLPHNCHREGASHTGK